MSKQVIVVRKDLNMRKGKMCAQAAHASMKIFFDLNIRGKKVIINLIIFLLKGLLRCDDLLIVPLTKNMSDWVNGEFKKITVYVNNEEELIKLYENAIAQGLPCSLIQDNGHTEFHGIKTYTCIAIGPENDEKIDEVTRHLPLL